MSPIVLTLFASQITASAGSPGAGTNTVSLSGVRGPNPVTPGPNDALFDVPQNSNVQLNINGASDEVAGGFAKGKTYRVTIEEVKSEASG